VKWPFFKSLPEEPSPGDGPDISLPAVSRGLPALRLPVNRAVRSDGADLANTVHECLDATYKTYGAAALTRVEILFRSVYAIDSFVTNGGFDAYFADCDDPHEWDNAIAGLKAMHQPQAARIVENARQVYQTTLPSDDADQATVRAYFEGINVFNQQWFDLDLNFNAVLSAFVDTHYPWA